MALVSVKELASRTLDYSENDTREYARVFQVRVDDPENTDGPYTVASYCGITIGDAWDGGESDVDAVCSGASARPVSNENGYVWTVEFRYTNKSRDQGTSTTGSEPGVPSGDPGQSNQSQDPDLRPWLVDIDAVEYTEPLIHDAFLTLFGEPVPVTNSAGQPFDPPYEVPKYRPQLTISGWKPIASDSYARTATYTGKVNSDTWMGFAPKTLLCKKYKIASQWEKGAWWWQKQVVIEVKATKWNKVKFLDQGVWFLPDAGQPPQQVKDLTGHPASHPMPFNGAGLPLDAATILAGAFKYVEYNAYEEVAFSGLL